MSKNPNKISEDKFDIECFDQAYDDYLKDPKTYSIEEVKKLLKIDD